MPSLSLPHASPPLLVAFLSLLLPLFSSFTPPASDFIFSSMALAGGIRNLPLNQNSGDLEELAKFAVQQFNSRQNSQLSYVGLVSAQKQVVAGFLYYLTIEADSGGETKLYQAKVLEKAWENLKSLESFEPIQGSSITTADLGVKSDGLHANSGAEVGLRSVPIDDPVVKEAAEQALKGLQGRSNSLIPYELKEVLLANAERTEHLTRFELVLGIARGAHEEKCKTKLERTVDGKWMVTHVQLDK